MHHAAEFSNWSSSPAVHNYGTVSRLLLLPLHSGNNVNHPSSLGWYSDLRPSVEVEVSDMLWLLFLVLGKSDCYFHLIKKCKWNEMTWTLICFDDNSTKKTGWEICSSEMSILILLSVLIKHYALVCRWEPCLWEWRFHTVYLQSAPPYNLQMLHCPLMANTGNTFPGWRVQMETQTGYS